MNDGVIRRGRHAGSLPTAIRARPTPSPFPSGDLRSCVQSLAPFAMAFLGVGIDRYETSFLPHGHACKSSAGRAERTNGWESDGKENFRGRDGWFQEWAKIAVLAKRCVKRRRPMRRHQRPNGTQVFHLRGRVSNHLGILSARQAGQPGRSGGGLFTGVRVFMGLGPQITMSRFDGCCGSSHVSEAATDPRGDPLGRTAADAMVHGTAPRLRVDGLGTGQKR